MKPVKPIDLLDGIRHEVVDEKCATARVGFFRLHWLGRTPEGGYSDSIHQRGMPHQLGTGRVGDPGQYPHGGELR